MKSAYHLGNTQFPKHLHDFILQQQKGQVLEDLYHLQCLLMVSILFCHFSEAWVSVILICIPGLLVVLSSLSLLRLRVAFYSNTFTHSENTLFTLSYKQHIHFSAESAFFLNNVFR